MPWQVILRERKYDWWELNDVNFFLNSLEKVNEYAKLIPLKNINHSYSQALYFLKKNHNIIDVLIESAAINFFLPFWNGKKSAVARVKLWAKIGDLNI